MNPQRSMFSYFSPESRVQTEHPLRTIKACPDASVRELSGRLNALYADAGRS